MALEMKVHKEITAFEPKPMFGLTWRRIGALAYMIFVGGGTFALITLALIRSSGGSVTNADDLGQATSIAMYAFFPMLIPAVIWAWTRPMGLKPEIAVQYVLRYHLVAKVINYADTYHDPIHRQARRRGDQSVPAAAGDPAARRGRSERRAEAKLRRTVAEREEEPKRQARRKARQARQDGH